MFNEGFNLPLYLFLWMRCNQLVMSYVCQSYSSDHLTPTAMPEMYLGIGSRFVSNPLSASSRTWIVPKTVGWHGGFQTVMTTSAGIYRTSFLKTSPKRSFSRTEKGHFELVFAKTGSINLGKGLQLIPTIAVRLVVFFTYFCYVLRQGKQNMSKQNILIHVSQPQSEIMDG